MTFPVTRASILRDVWSNHASFHLSECQNWHKSSHSCTWQCLLRTRTPQGSQATGGLAILCNALSFQSCVQMRRTKIPLRCCTRYHLSFAPAWLTLCVHCLWHWLTLRHCRTPQSNTEYVQPLLANQQNWSISQHISRENIWGMPGYKYRQKKHDFPALKACLCLPLPLCLLSCLCLRWQGTCFIECLGLMGMPKPRSELTWKHFIICYTSGWVATWCMTIHHMLYTMPWPDWGGKFELQANPEQHFIHCFILLLNLEMILVTGIHQSILTFICFNLLSMWWETVFFSWIWKYLYNIRHHKKSRNLREIRVNMCQWHKGHYVGH